jgi:hypothetical protein
VGTSRKHRSPVYTMIVHPFLIYFRIQKQPATVYIVKIHHGRQRQPRQFE